MDSTLKRLHEVSSGNYVSAYPFGGVVWLVTSDWSDLAEPKYNGTRKLTTRVCVSGNGVTQDTDVATLVYARKSFDDRGPQCPTCGGRGREQ